MLSPDFNRNYFELFDLQPSYQLDLAQLQLRQQSLQSDCHPDRFVNAGEREKRISVQMASWVNQAFETLSDPVKRANYLLELGGLEALDESETTSDTAFLMEQIELREQIDACRQSDDALDCCDRVAADLQDRARLLSDEFLQQFDKGELTAARQISQKMQFIQRIQQQLGELQFELEDF